MSDAPRDPPPLPQPPRERSAPARHLTERQLAEALLPGAKPPVCPVPGCSECPARLAAAQRIAQRFHDEVLPRTLPNIEGAAPRSRLLPGLFSQLMRPWVMGGLVTVAAVLVWIKIRQAPSPLPRPDAGVADAYLGIKDADDGGVAIYLRRGESVRPLADGATVHPGDALRFAVDPARGKYALVVSIDGANQISVYAPFGGDAAALVPPAANPQGEAAKVELPGSVELDATLGDERLWIILADAPLPVAALRPQLERLAAGGAEAVRAATAVQLLEGLTEPRGLRAVTYLLHKTASP